MKNSDKITLLMFAFEGVLKREEPKQDCFQILYDFQLEIEEYFQKLLPKQNQDYGKSVIKELQDVTVAIWKNYESPKKSSVMEHCLRLSIAASFIPSAKQDIK